jgi:hypothetical protein
MSSVKINKWQIYCNNEGSWSEGWLDDGLIPTKCFNDGSHDVNIESAIIIDTLEEQSVSIKEETVPTGGHFSSKGIFFNCPVGLSQYDISFPFNISALSVSFQTRENQTEDIIDLIIGKDSIIGTLTNNVYISDTVLNVTNTVVDNIKLGFFVMIDSTEVGQVISIDKLNSQITIDRPCSRNYESLLYIKTYPKVINDFTIGYPGLYEIGKGKIGGSHIPANTIITFKYNNNGESLKKFFSFIDYLY